jgi:hypothetical protein
MAQQFVHTVHVDGRWQNTVEGESSPMPGTYDTREEAVAAGRTEAQRRGTDHVIHRKDGRLDERNSYGDDPSIGRAESGAHMANTPQEPTQEELQEYLHCWTLPGGRLTPEQTRALLAWDGTPEAERAGLEANLASTEQEVPAEPLAPNQRRGHVSWLDRLKHVLRH